MAMQDLPIDFGELEKEDWGEESVQETDLESIFARSSSAIFSSSFTSITKGSPFFDYSSFLSYISQYDIKVIQESDLRRVAKLGGGLTMSVFRGTCPSSWGDTEVALKRLNLELPRTKSALPPNLKEQNLLIAAAALEVRVLSDGLLRNHRNIVDLLGVSWEELGDEDETQGQPFRSIRPILIVELACPQYPTLDKYFKYLARQNMGIDLDTKISIVCDVADALSAVHLCGVIHGDIKPQNILLFRKGPNEPLIAKLSDFGGSQPPTDDEEASIQEFPVLGTDYWNPPEVHNAKGQPTLASRKVTRDYYSMGLLVYYVLFEEMLLGDDEDLSDEDLERIARIKSYPLLIKELLKRKMALHWTLVNVSDKEAKAEIFNATPLIISINVLKRLLAEKRVAEFSLQGSPRGFTSGEESRQYLLYLVICQFLRHDPEARQRGLGMGEFRLFFRDSHTTRALRDVYLVDCWELVLSKIEKGELDLWAIREIEGPAPALRPTMEHGKYVLDWKGRHGGLKPRTGPNSIFDFTDILEIPYSLRRVFIQELEMRARNVEDPQCITSLLCLEFCKSLMSYPTKDNQPLQLGYFAEEEPRSYAMEAAILGSATGKFLVFATARAGNSRPPISSEVQCQWILDIILSRMPSKEEFKQQILGTFSDFEFLANLLYWELEIHKYYTPDLKIHQADGPDGEVNKLFSAVILGQVNEVRNLLGGSGIGNLNARLNSLSLLHVASDHGYSELVRLLTRDFGMDVNELSGSGVPPITLAARSGQNDTIYTLHDLGADFRRLICAHTLREVANHGRMSTLRILTVLASSWSAVSEEPFTLNSFLDGNITVYSDDESCDEPDFPPIFAAILGDNMDTFRGLLELGCSRDIYTEFTNGFLAPIHIAANFRPLFLAILLHYGALPDIRTRDHHQSTALQLACVARSITRYYYPRVAFLNITGINLDLDSQPGSCLNTKLFMIRLLVKQYGADVNAQDWFGRTALSLCLGDRNNSANDNLAMAQYLVEECNADIHIKDFRGGSCLHRALTVGAGLKHVEFCVRHGLSLNEKEAAGFTPLMVAASCSTVENCQYLVDHGADFFAICKSGLTCVHYATENNKRDVFSYLFGVAEKQQFLPKLVSMTDLQHQTLIHRIIRSKSNTLCGYLSRFTKADISGVLEEPDIVGYTLLHYAVLAENRTAIEFLLQLGANVNAKGWKNLSPLHIAYANADQSVIEMLGRIEGADLGCYDVDGRTPEAFGKLYAEDPDLWPTLVKACNQEGDDRGEKIDADLIETQNREKAAPKDGWFVV